MHFSIAKKYKTRIGQIAVFGLLYFVANLISFIFPDAETALMVIWPAGGIGFCAFLLTPKRFWTVLAFALFAIGIAADVFFAHRLLLASMGYMFANIGESIACSWLVLKVSKRFNNFESINEILALLGATFLINALTSCFGAATSYFVKDVSFVESWLSWYISDGLSLLIMGPFLVSWVTIKNVASAFSPRRWIEFIIFVITWVIANIAIFRSVPYENHIALHPYVLIALLLWPAIRLGLRGVTLAFVITFLISIVNQFISKAQSPFNSVNLDLIHRLLELEIFMGFMSIVGYVLTVGYSTLLRTEASLRESEEKFRLMLKNSNDSFVLINAKGEQFFISDAATRDTGYTVEELKGPIQNVIFPEDLENVMNAWDEVLSKKGEVVRVQYRHIHKFKNYIWYEAAAQNFLDIPTIKAVVVNVRDITILKESEQELIRAKETAEDTGEKYRLLLDNINELVCEVDKDGVFTYVSDNYKEIMGYEKEELLGRRAIEIIHPEDLEASIKRHDVLRDNLGRSVDIWRFRHKNGDYRIIESKGTVYKNLKNETRTVVISRDVTAQKQAELDLKQAKEKAEESDRLKTAFLQNMSHEIRTPMNAIKGFAELLKREFNNKTKLERYANIINQRSNDLLDIINDILDISRIESGQLPITQEECNINELFSELKIFFLEYQKRIDKQSIGFSLVCSCSSDNTVIITDRVKLKQIFINLITNAFKFTEEGRVEGGCKLDKKQNFVFYVTDTGVGIPPNKQAVIFERFAQLEQPLNRNFGGTGLGLSIVKGLVDLLGGNITLHSVPGEGSTFTFTISYNTQKIK